MDFSPRFLAPCEPPKLRIANPRGMVQAKVTNGEPGTLVTGVHGCLPGQALRSLTLPARLSEAFTLRSGDLNHALRYSGMCPRTSILGSEIDLGTSLLVRMTRSFAALRLFARQV